MHTCTRSPRIPPIRYASYKTGPCVPKVTHLIVCVRGITGREIMAVICKRVIRTGAMFARAGERSAVPRRTHPTTAGNNSRAFSFRNNPPRTNNLLEISGPLSSSITTSGCMSSTSFGIIKRAFITPPVSPTRYLHRTYSTYVSSTASAIMSGLQPPPLLLLA
jgi:hypothetical protein